MEREGQKIDKEFTDLAWAEMSRVLDREMPVAAPLRKRRAAAWWWLLAGLGLGAGIAGLWFSSIEELPPPALGERPVAQTEKQGQYETSSPVIGNTKTVEPVPMDVATPPPPAPSSSNAGTAIMPVSTSYSTAFEQHPPASHGNPQPPALANPLVTEHDALAGTRSTFSVSGLASLSLAPLPERQPELRLAVAEQHGGKSRPEFLAYASALTSPVSGGSGLAAGAMVAFPLKNPRLSIETGLGYNYIRQPLSILAPDGEDASSSTPAEDENQNVVYGFEDLTSKAEYLESNYLLATQDLGLHYAEVPVHFSFQASPKWQFVAGLNMLVLLESSPGFTGGGLLDAVTAVQEDMANGGPFSNGISSSTLHVPLSKIDAQLSAGARYRLNQRWSVGLQYQTGTVDVVKSNGAADYHRLLRLSLFHHFSK
ncbi:MAG: hypothetical protein ACE5FF_03675 [Saprospiraceae bacterium]